MDAKQMVYDALTRLNDKATQMGEDQQTTMMGMQDPLFRKSREYREASEREINDTIKFIMMTNPQRAKGIISDLLLRSRMGGK